LGPLTNGRTRKVNTPRENGFAMLPFDISSGYFHLHDSSSTFVFIADYREHMDN
jgi:hypothetical protein